MTVSSVYAENEIIWHYWKYRNSSSFTCFVRSLGAHH